MDGGQLERVAIANITIQGVTLPLFLRLGDRGRPFRSKFQSPPPIGSFRDVVINNIVATEVGPIGCSLTGQPGHPLENILLSNLAFTFEGGGTSDWTTKEVLELPKQYPERAPCSANYRCTGFTSGTSADCALPMCGCEPSIRICGAQLFSKMSRN